MSAITGKINRLITDNGGELNGIMNASLLMEILNDLAPSYQKLCVLVTQDGEDDPVLTILENTFPEDLEINISRNSIGLYILEMPEALPQGRTSLLQSASVFYTAGLDDFIKAFPSTNESEITIRTYRVEEGVSTLRDSVLNNTFLEIRVYPAE